MGSAGDRDAVSQFDSVQGSPFGLQWEVPVTVVRSHDSAWHSWQGSPFGLQWEVQCCSESAKETSRLGGSEDLGCKTNSQEGMPTSPCLR